MLSVAFQMVLDCPHCVEHIPINAVVPGAHCPQCKRALPLGAETWSKILGQAVDAALRLPEGEPDLVIESSPGGDINLIFKRDRAKCGMCELELDLDAALQQARTTQGWTQCPRCQGWLAFRPPPIAIRPSVVGLMCEQFSATASSAPASANEPIAFSCQQCGAVLPVDGTSRMVACQYCRASVVLPDQLWKTVHPKGKASYWYLVLHGPPPH